MADDPTKCFDLGDVAKIPLGDLDVILMRKDPPFDIDYIAATYILQRAEHHGTVVVSRPQGLRDVNEKTFLAWFSDCAPPALVSRSMDEIRSFMAEHRKVVVKPLTERDRWICEQIGPKLRDRGLLFTGIDVIGEFMTELNVTSVTGIRESERASGARIAKQVLDAIASKLA